MPAISGRLLPFTIAALAGLLTLKGVSLATTVMDQARADGPGLSSPHNDRPTSDIAPVPDPISAATDRRTSGKPDSLQTISRASANDAPGWQLLEAIRAEKLSLDARAKTLAAREAAVDAASAAMSARYERVKAAERAMSHQAVAEEDAKARSWDALVQVYEDMRPDDAGTIFDTLDVRTTVEILRRMKERKAAPILSAMTPDRARVATQMLASRLSAIGGASATHADVDP